MQRAFASQKVLSNSMLWYFKLSISTQNIDKNCEDHQEVGKTTTLCYLKSTINISLKGFQHINYKTPHML